MGDLLLSLQQQQALVKLLQVRIQLLQQHLSSLANLDLQKIIQGDPEIHHLPQIRLLNPDFLRLKIQNPDLLQQQLKVRVRSELGPVLPKSAHGRMIRSRQHGCSNYSPEWRENRRESHAPFVKTYATLGYL